VFDNRVSQIKVDLGHDLSVMEHQLVENFAAISVMINHLTVQILLGEAVDPFELCQLSSASVRVANKLGLRRHAKDVLIPGSLSDWGSRLSACAA
jgi:hypothetical protein